MPKFKKKINYSILIKKIKKTNKKNYFLSNKKIYFLLIKMNFFIPFFFNRRTYSFFDELRRTYSCSLCSSPYMIHILT